MMSESSEEIVSSILSLSQSICEKATDLKEKEIAISTCSL